MVKKPRPEQFRTPAQLRQMVLRGLARVDKLTPDLAKEVAQVKIPARSKRPKPEQAGMSEKAMLAIRAEEMAWFASHPNETVYYRRIVPGELPPSITAEWIRVTKIDAAANERVRQPVVRIVGARGLEWADWKS